MVQMTLSLDNVVDAMVRGNVSDLEGVEKKEARIKELRKGRQSPPTLVPQKYNRIPNNYDEEWGGQTRGGLSLEGQILDLGLFGLLDVDRFDFCVRDMDFFDKEKGRREEWGKFTFHLSRSKLTGPNLHEEITRLTQETSQLQKEVAEYQNRNKDLADRLYDRSSGIGLMRSSLLSAIAFLLCFTISTYTTFHLMHPSISIVGFFSSVAFYLIGRLNNNEYKRRHSANVLSTSTRDAG